MGTKTCAKCKRKMFAETARLCVGCTEYYCVGCCDAEGCCDFCAAESERAETAFQAQAAAIAQADGDYRLVPEADDSDLPSFANHAEEIAWHLAQERRKAS